MDAPQVKALESKNVVFPGGLPRGGRQARPKPVVQQRADMPPFLSAAQSLGRGRGGGGPPGYSRGRGGGGPSSYGRGGAPSLQQGRGGGGDGGEESESESEESEAEDQDSMSSSDDERPAGVVGPDGSCLQCANPTLKARHTCKKGSKLERPKGAYDGVCKQCSNPSLKEKHTCGRCPRIPHRPSPRRCPAAISSSGELASATAAGSARAPGGAGRRPSRRR